MYYLRFFIGAACGRPTFSATSFLYFEKSAIEFSDDVSDCVVIIAYGYEIGSGFHVVFCVFHRNSQAGRFNHGNVVIVIPDCNGAFSVDLHYVCDFHDSIAFVYALGQYFKKRLF